ncbi:Gastricsin [Arthrobotrys entomopaga]|nr:Gastricsin [Arthrobotrys entomopaga]
MRLLLEFAGNALVLLVSSVFFFLATTTQSVGAIKATSLTLRTNPNANLRLTKRDYITTTFRPNNETVFGFFVDVLVGTPPQFFSLQFSTSTTTWLPSPKNTTVQKFCKENGTGNSFWSCFYPNFYNPKASSSYKPRNGTLNNYYGTGLFVRTYGSDTFKMNQLTIPNVYFGLADNYTNAAELGLGVERPRTHSPYPSLPEVMAEEGAINLIMYSVYVNDIRNDGGQIYFGALDDAKFSGTMTTYDSETVGQVPVSGVFWIDGTGKNSSLTSGRGGSSTGGGEQVGEIQLGTPALWLPNNVYTSLINSIPALTYATAYEAYVVDCNIDNSRLGTLQFNIAGQFISIDARQILVEYPTGSGNCVFTLYQTEQDGPGDPEYLLGTPFLRAAYTVFDYTNNRTSIASSIANSTASTLIEVPAGGVLALPERSGQPGSPTTTTSPTLPTLSGGPSPSSPPTTTSTSSGSKSTPVGAIAGGAIGGVAFLAILGILFYFFCYRKGGKDHEMSEAPLPPGQQQQDGLGSPGNKETGYTHSVAAYGSTPASPTPYSGTIPPIAMGMGAGQHTYGITPQYQNQNQNQQQHQGYPPAPPPEQVQQQHVNAPPSSYHHDNWGGSGGVSPGGYSVNGGGGGYADRGFSSSNGNNNNNNNNNNGGRPSSAVSGSTAGSGGPYNGPDLSSFGGQPGQAGGMQQGGLNAQGVYGNYGYSGYGTY